MGTHLKKINKITFDSKGDFIEYFKNKGFKKLSFQKPDKDCFCHTTIKKINGKFRVIHTLSGTEIDTLDLEFFNFPSTWYEVSNIKRKHR